MRKYYLPTILFLLGMLLAAPVLAAQGDVVVSSEIYVYLSDPGETLAIAAATVDQIAVTDSTVSITMSAGGDAVTISSPGRYRLSITSGITDPGTTCGSGSSTLVIPAQTSSKVVVVDPSTTCPSGGGGGGVAPVTTTPAVPTTTTGTVTATAAAGGVTSIVSSGVTASVSLPANAVSANTTVAVVPTAKTESAVSTAVAAIPSTVNMVGANVYNYSASSGGVSVSTFSKAVTVSITYTDAQIVGLTLASLKIYYYNETTNQWVALSSVINTTDKTVTASTTHFTYFVIMGTEEGTEVTEEVTEETTTTTPVSGMTLAELKAEIVRITALIAQLQVELLKMIGTTEGCTIVSFDRNLQLAMTGDDVKCLQILLNSSADTQVASSGVGSSGNETSYFGSLTKAAVIKFQNKYTSEVLTPWGLTSGNGFVGSKTREKLNELLAK